MMTRERGARFNEDVERYRRALLYFARASDWKTFRTKAGRLFDYLESVEFAELERRFFKNFSFILAALIVIAISLFQVDFTAAPELLRLKYFMVLAGLGMGSFELFFYIDYRTYVRVRTVNYEERRERFIRSIQQDFASFAIRTELRQAA